MPAVNELLPTGPIVHRTSSIGTSCQRQGSALVLLFLLLPVVLAVASYAINVVYMELVRTELQIATDVTTRAAGRVYAISRNKEAAVATAKWIASLNRVGSMDLQIGSEDILFGVSQRDEANQRYKFEDGKSPNSVHLRTESMAIASGSGVPMLFPTMGVPVAFKPIKSATSTQLELDVALVLDRSSSMAFRSNEISVEAGPLAALLSPAFGRPVPPEARWLDVVASANSFLKVMSQTPHDERVALVTFANSATTDVSLRNRYSPIVQRIQSYSNRFSGGRSKIDVAIAEALSALSDKRVARTWGTRIMIVMSDGLHDGGQSPAEAAALAAKKGVNVFAISFSDEANQSLMKSIAAAGRGKHIHATSSRELADAFEDIARTLPTLLTH